MIMTYKCNLFKIYKEYCRPPCTSTDDIKFRLPGVAVIFVHEIVKVMNKCHYYTSSL